MTFLAPATYRPLPARFRGPGYGTGFLIQERDRATEVRQVFYRVPDDAPPAGPGPGPAGPTGPVVCTWADVGDFAICAFEVPRSEVYGAPEVRALLELQIRGRIEELESTLAKVREWYPSLRDQAPTPAAVAVATVLSRSKESLHISDVVKRSGYGDRMVKKVLTRIAEPFGPDGHWTIRGKVPQLSDDSHPFRLRRLSLGISSKELAARIGVPVKTLSKWERYEKFPSEARLAAWKAALHGDTND